MKSLCIKTNNEDILNFLNNSLLKLDLNDIYITRAEFKIYKNIIVHYVGEDFSRFHDNLSSIISNCIINFYEKKLLKRILEYNYFYFDSSEKKDILEVAEDFIEEDLISKEDNFYSIYSAVSDYIKENKSLVLEGFVNFRLYNYMKSLDYIIDFAVNKYITDKEYMEFINMLKLYVSFTPPKISLIHLIFLGNECILLDKDKNFIPITDENLNAKYLSDITFTQNDYALNTLLNLTPKKIIIHLIDKHPDEVINTIKLIFEGRCTVCSSCELCTMYKKIVR